MKKLSLSLLFLIGCSVCPFGSNLLAQLGGSLTSGGSGSGDALVANPLSQFAPTTSAQLRGVLSDELGTGAFLCDGATPTSLTLTNASGLPESGVTSLVSDLALKAPLASPTLTGTVTLPASTAFVTPVLGTPTSGNLANCTFPTLNQNTTGSAASLSVSGQTGLVTVTGLASTNRAKTVRDAADTILELGGSYTPTGTWTNLQMVTPNANTISSIPGNDFLAQPSVPGVLTTAVAGNAGTYRGGDAIAGSSVAGAAAGGNASLQAGDAKRLTSGNANGGDAQIKGGIGVGTGTAGSVNFLLGGSQRWRFDGNSPFPLLAFTDNAADIGASGANRPRTVYAGTSVVAPTFTASTAFTGPNAQIANASTSSVSAGYAADTYLAGSSCVVAAGAIRATSTYHCVFDMVKTAAGTATPIITVRVGTAGTTSDTARITFTFGAGTAVADTGKFEVWVVFRTVGSGTSAVVSGICTGDHTLATTGLFNNAAIWTIVGTVSGGFDSSTATTVGLSFNGGASFSGTGTVVSSTLTQ